MYQGSWELYLPLQLLTGHHEVASYCYKIEPRLPKGSKRDAYRQVGIRLLGFLNTKVKLPRTQCQLGCKDRFFLYIIIADKAASERSFLGIWFLTAAEPCYIPGF